MKMKRAGAVAAVMALALSLTAVSQAAVPDSTTGVITGCFTAASGNLRVIDAEAGDQCRKGETLLTWNQTGPQGPQGLQGPAGVDGADGADGADGQSCAATNDDGTLVQPLCQGPAGPAGITGPAGPAGITGPVGPAGPAGPAGSSGLTTFSFQESSSSLAAATSGTRRILCPVGQHVISGGYQISGIDNDLSVDNIHLLENRSFAGDVDGVYREGWQINVRNPSFEAITLTVEATCLVV